METLVDSEMKRIAGFGASSRENIRQAKELTERMWGLESGLARLGGPAH